MSGATPCQFAATPTGARAPAVTRYAVQGPFWFLGSAPAMAAAAVKITKRLRSKTPDPRVVSCQQTPFIGDASLHAGTEAKSAKKRVYLVTFVHPRVERSVDGVQLLAPETVGKPGVLERVLEACARPVYHNMKDSRVGSTVHVKTAGVWSEAHKPDAEARTHMHFHVALLAEAQFSFLPVKRALLLRFALASHWSCDHDGYWSAVRYCSLPSPRKPVDSLDHHPLLYAAVGAHPPLDMCTHEPATAVARRAKRLAAEQRAAGAGKKEPRATDMDLWPIVVAAGIRNTSDGDVGRLKLMAHVKAHCSAAIQEFVFRNRSRLAALIDDVWQWEEVEAAVAASQRSRVDCLREAATSQCVCAGEWPRFVASALLANGVNVGELASDVFASLDSGRGPRTPVIVLAGAQGGEGKSIFLKGLAAVFQPREVFHAPQPGSFPLLGLDMAKVAILDDFRFDQTVLSYQTQCLWFDGSGLPIARPQNQPGLYGHMVYSGTAPVFASTKLQEMEALAAAAAPRGEAGQPGDADASMLLRRLKVYTFGTRVPPPPGHFPACRRCFAQLILSQASGITAPAL